jgi:serine O-acetyltransferase
VVLANVPPHTTVAGVPAVVVGTSSEENPAIEMNQHLDCQDAR